MTTETKTLTQKPKWWMTAALLTASIYFVVWGILIVLFPNLLFNANHISMPNYIFIWQSMGGLEVIFGLGLLVIAKRPYHNWLFLASILAYKVFATAIYFNGAMHNDSLFSLTNYIFIDNIIWTLPFGIILWRSYQFHSQKDDFQLDYFGGEEFTLDMFETSEGLSLEEMNHKWPTLVVFLRHFGCTFCREAMRDLSKVRSSIEANGTRILIVHMLEDEDDAQEQLKKFGLDDIPTLSDPEKFLYKKFQLKQGSFWQLFGLKVWMRGIYKATFSGLGLGAPKGDPFQMPGVFLMYKNNTVKSYVHESAADKPEYVQLALCDNCF